MDLTHRRGFTLIELLIVVAIIAVLAAIAVPNFLEAQTRSRVSRVKADLRSLATAVEAYYIDWSAYPMPADEEGNPVAHPFAAHPNETLVPVAVTTPVAYIASRPPDPFNPAGGLFHYSTRSYETAHHGDPHGFDETIEEVLEMRASSLLYFLTSPGPDGNADIGSHSSIDALYDPTNGTISGGDIVYWGPGRGFHGS